MPALSHYEFRGNPLLKNRFPPPSSRREIGQPYTTRRTRDNFSLRPTSTTSRARYAEKSIFQTFGRSCLGHRVRQEFHCYIHDSYQRERWATSGGTVRFIVLDEGIYRAACYSRLLIASGPKIKYPRVPDVYISPRRDGEPVSHISRCTFRE